MRARRLLAFAVLGSLLIVAVIALTRGPGPSPLLRAAEVVPADALAFAAVDLDDPDARALAARLGARPADGDEQAALWVTRDLAVGRAVRRDGRWSGSARRATSPARSLRRDPRFSGVGERVRDGADGAGFYDPRGLVAAAARRAGAGRPLTLAAINLLRVGAAKPVFGPIAIERRTAMLDARSPGCFDDAGAADAPTADSALNLGLPLAGVAARRCDQGIAPPSSGGLTIGSDPERPLVDVDRDLLAWFAPESLALTGRSRRSLELGVGAGSNDPSVAARRLRGLRRRLAAVAGLRATLGGRTVGVGTERILRVHGVVPERTIVLRSETSRSLLRVERPGRRRDLDRSFQYERSVPILEALGRSFDASGYVNLDVLAALVRRPALARLGTLAFAKPELDVDDSNHRARLVLLAPEP